MQECLNYDQLDGQRVRCNACAHHCIIRKNQTGICGVRQNINGKLYLLPYGQAAAVNVDPVEKKPLFHFLPGSFAYSLGTLGCNLRCANCQNFDISQIYGHKGKVKEYGDINWGENFSPIEIVKQAKHNSCKSIAYTYNEPTIWLEYALDTMRLAHAHGLKNVWVSNGFMSRATLELIVPYLDAINIDIKSFDDEFYQKNCGARLQPILDNCQYLNRETNVWLEITTLIIPTLSDDKRMLKKLAQFMAEKLAKDVPWHISAFSGKISWKLQKLPSTPLTTIKQTYDLGKAAGLHYVYAGNVWLTELENTYCPKCGATVIERTGYRVSRHDYKGTCRECGEKIAGVFY